MLKYWYKTIKMITSIMETYNKNNDYDENDRNDDK